MILSGWYQKFCSFLPQQIPGPIAVLYDKVASPAIRGFHKKVASEITATLKSGKVLDIGTGPGHLLLEIARQNPDLDLVGCAVTAGAGHAVELVLVQAENLHALAKSAEPGYGAGFLGGACEFG